jgi:hypothetical protein
MYNCRRLQGSDPNPHSLVQCTRAALLRLNRPLDYDHFVLPACILSTATKRPERAYARFLYPAASATWRAEICALPAIPSRHHSYTSLFTLDLHRRNLFLPALWLRQTATVPATISLLQFRAQASSLPTHHHHVPSQVGAPAIPYRAFLLRLCPYCPHHVGEEIHMLLQCPGLRPTLSPLLRDFTDLLSAYDLIDVPMTHSEYLSLLLGTDPCTYLHGIDRLEWISSIIPLSIRLVRAVAHALSL